MRLDCWPKEAADRPVPMLLNKDEEDEAEVVLVWPKVVVVWWAAGRPSVWPDVYGLA